LDKVLSARSTGEAAKLLGEIAEPGDLVLIKGSRAARTEEVIEQFGSQNSAVRDFAMMYYLHHLSSHFIGFNVFLYVTFRAIAAAVTAFLTTLIFGNFIIAKAAGTESRTTDSRSGGSPPACRTARGEARHTDHGRRAGDWRRRCSSILWARLDNKFVWLALFSMVYLGGLGFADDYLKVTKKKSEGIHGRIKLAFQIILAAIITGIFLTDPLLGSAGSYALRAFHQNAGDCEYELVHLRVFCAGHRRHIECVNLTDGLDGLAIGCTITVAFAYALLCYAAGNFRVANTYRSVLSVRRRTDRCLLGAYRRGAGLSLVQLLSGQGFHGRHRIAGHRRHDRRCCDLL
jgi:UDP-N-acetylmuramyl pentapeptide phosphotransferase/UDP-N-acetylglucosamine-1-phosphate transferase